MNNIQFSVIIPLYDKCNSILATLESVKSQRFKVSEIIVIDDGSTDNGPEIVEQLNWPELRLVRQDNKGVSAARNLGVELAKFPYLAFLDADDQWLPLHLTEIEKLIVRFPQRSFFATNYQKKVGGEDYQDAKVRLTNLSPKGFTMDNYFEIAGNGDLPFMISSSVIKKDFLNSIGGFPENQWMGEDQSVFSQAALHESIAYSPQIRLLYHTDTENRACEKEPPNTMCEFAGFLEAQLKQNNVPKKYQRHIKQYVATHICNLAKRNVKAGCFSPALRLLSHSYSIYRPIHCLFWFLRALFGCALNILKSPFQTALS